MLSLMMYKSRSNCDNHPSAWYQSLTVHIIDFAELNKKYYYYYYYKIYIYTQYTRMMIDG